MGERMDSRIIKKSDRKFVRHFPVTRHSMDCFSSVRPKESIELNEFYNQIKAEELQKKHLLLSQFELIEADIFELCG